MSLVTVVLRTTCGANLSISSHVSNTTPKGATLKISSVGVREWQPTQWVVIKLTTRSLLTSELAWATALLAVTFLPTSSTRLTSSCPSFDVCDGDCGHDTHRAIASMATAPDTKIPGLVVPT